jgi:low affinity Fe/Cu permease
LSATRPSQIPQGRTRFDRFAGWSAHIAGEASFFAVSLIAVAIWIPTIAVFHSVDTWQLVINTVTSVFAFLLVALLQNSERRTDLALHRKIDAVAEALIALMSNELEGDRDALERELTELRAGIGLEQRI